MVAKDRRTLAQDLEALDSNVHVSVSRAALLAADTVNSRDEKLKPWVRHANMFFYAVSGSYCTVTYIYLRLLMVVAVAEVVACVTYQ